QILSYSWEISDDRETQCFQVLNRSDTRKHQQLGRVDGPTRENHFLVGIDLLLLAILDIRDADCSCPLEDDVGDERMRLQGEIGATQDGMDVANRSTMTESLPLRHLVKAHAILLRAIEVVHQRKACF